MTPLHPQEAVETSALIPQIDLPSQTTANANFSSSSHPRRRQKTVIYLCFLMILCVDSGAFLQVAPRTQLFESIICRNLYSSFLLDHRPPDKGDDPCKDGNVQSKVAFVQGMQQLFDCVPSEWESLLCWSFIFPIKFLLG